MADASYTTNKFLILIPGLAHLEHLFCPVRKSVPAQHNDGVGEDGPRCPEGDRVHGAEGQFHLPDDASYRVCVIDNADRLDEDGRDQVSEALSNK
jgi:hypothetical protein